MIFSSDDYGFGIAAITFVVVISVWLQHIFHKRVGKKTLKDLHDVAGVYFSAVGTLYAVILGMVIVDSSNRFNDARQKTVSESNMLTEVYALAEMMPQRNRNEIKTAIRRYVDYILTDGWSHLQRDIVDESEIQLFDRIIMVARTVEPKSENQKTLYPALIQSLTAAAEDRAARVDTQQYNIPKIEWVSMILGGSITIAFTFFFAIDNRRIQSTMTAMVAFVLALNLYIAYLFDSPYTGILSVSKQPFLDLQNFILQNP